MVLCIRAEFSDIDRCKNSFSGPGSNGVRARVRSYRKDIKPLFKPKVSSSYDSRFLPQREISSSQLEARRFSCR